MTVDQRAVTINGASHVIHGFDGYFSSQPEAFEPKTVALFDAFCADEAVAFDIGANIGLTAIALAQACPRGAVYAVEPVPRTFCFG